MYEIKNQKNKLRAQYIEKRKAIPPEEKAELDKKMERYRKIYLGYVGDIKALEEQGKSKEEARKIVYDAIAAQEDGAETIAKLKEYLRVANETDFEAVTAWVQKIGEELQAALQKFSDEMPQALQQLIDIAKQEGGMALMKIPSQGKDDLAVIGGQLADAGKGIALYLEMSNADKDAASLQAEYPVEE